MDLIKLFSDCIPSERIVSKENILEKYSTDESFQKFSFPLAALLPLTTEEVACILKKAYKNEIVTVPRGLGTGLSGGAIPLKPSIIVSMELMNKILEVDVNNMMVVTQPGVITGVLQREVEKFNLYYPPDPASLDSCSVGGNVAESSGGPSAVRYGTTKDYVRGIEFVSPAGEIMRFGGKVRKDATGYAMKDIIIGSEGTLGMITQITLSLIPLPKFRVDLLIPFETIGDATAAVVETIKSSIKPTTVEFMEKRAIEAAGNFLGNEMPCSEGEAHILMRIDSDSRDEMEERILLASKIAGGFTRYEILVAETFAQQEKLWKARRSLHDAMVQMSVKREREDVVVPISMLPRLISEIHSIGDFFKVPIIAFGHAGDGNVHINVLKLKNEDDFFEDSIGEITERILKTAVNLGGKLSGEHGIGIFKREFMSLVFTEEEINLQKRIKLAFDPKNLFNPNKIFFYE
ncbi:MAG: FAD-binding oxidoreductase [bacterium]|nr:FAD-binding oxidoreductase [bacterium]